MNTERSNQQPDDLKALAASEPNIPDHNNRDKTQDEHVDDVIRTCNISVSNWTGGPIRCVSLRHRMHNEAQGEQYINANELGHGDRTEYVIINYLTGWTPGNDYWYIQFQDADEQWWNCKDNFYCNLKKADENKHITFALEATKMTAHIPSGGCYITIRRANNGEDSVSEVGLTAL